jgi:hypothetical protein
LCFNSSDLDDTLYPGDTGIGLALKRNIDEFLEAKLGVTAERAAAMRVELFRTYGSSLAGLIVRCSSDFFVLSHFAQSDLSSPTVRLVFFLIRFVVCL